MDRNDQRDHVFPTNSTVSTQSSSQKPNQSLAESLVGACTKFVGSHRLSRFVVAGVLSVFNRSRFSVVAAVVPLGKQIAKRNDPFTDEASKYTRASSMSKPVGHKGSRACIRATSQELTVDLRSRNKGNPLCKARRIQARHRATHCISHVLPGIQKKSQNLKCQIWNLLLDAKKENCTMHSRQLESPIIPMFAHRETDGSLD